MNGGLRLRDRVAVVTGGAAGIGRAITERLADEGARVSVLDVSELAPDAFGRRSDAVMPIRCDVAQEAQVAVAVAATVERFGRLDVLVNNAGVNAYFDATAMTEDQWEQFMAVDLKGAWLCSKHAIPHLRAAGGGVIVNIASVHAFATTTGMFPYAAAKSGIVGLTRSLALDHGRDGIRVVAVCPGWIHTHLVDEWLARQPDPDTALREVIDIHPLRRIGTPADVASMVAFVASDEAAFVTGVALLVDGGVSARMPI